MMGKCLVVDDEPDVERLIRQRFRHEIKDGHLNFLFASDGLEAIERLETHPDIDMVLTDINMPRMDGLTLLSRIQDINPVARTVVVSAYGDMDNIRTSMNRGAFDFIIKPINFDDLRATMEKTLNFVAQVKESVLSTRENHLLKMYVNPSIIHYLKDREGNDFETVGEQELKLAPNRRITASVMFADICGFTALAETLEPDNIALLLNTFFEEIAREVIIHNGQIDKFIGDAAMIVFEGQDHVLRSVKTAFGIIKRINSFAGKELISGVSFPDIRIGINSGEMISGNFGSISLGRLDYTVIGDVVNTASRLESLAKAGQILVSPEIQEQIQEHYPCEEVGEILLKNKSRPLRVFKIEGLAV